MKTNWTEHQERHYMLAGAHALAAESKPGTIAPEINSICARKRAELIADAPDLLAQRDALLGALQELVAACDIEKCDRCGGDGTWPDEMNACPTCGGCGEIIRHEYWPEDVRKARTALALVKGAK